jgi:hypothetical protein
VGEDGAEEGEVVGPVDLEEEWQRHIVRICSCLYCTDVYNRTTQGVKPEVKF